MKLTHKQVAILKGHYVLLYHSELPKSVKDILLNIIEIIEDNLQNNTLLNIIENILENNEIDYDV